MKKLNLLFLLVMSSFVFSQTTFQNAYRIAFADALCYRENYTCQRKAPMLSDIPLPNYDESPSNYLDGYARGIVDGFSYKNEHNKTDYDYQEYAQHMFDLKKASRERAVQQTEQYYNEDLQRRHPRPTDPQKRALYDAIMSNNL